ncbi:Exc2 family lipoprotein [Pantoea sp. ACRSH]|uniref:Exc2 family lipoprotein n=1 Tax=unclassified Pantoea TaxID=2630326 RepID=UPI001EF4A296|nr:MULTISPECIES: Exc2 family lipoprotein [unclassified Pantoea]MCG7367673.1 Exc2 family lipoprotein [Pantoea sp. ACRSH]MCG7398740.1 Exc2 family lipoprotein [Pantoea sp. ACRSC]
MKLFRWYFCTMLAASLLLTACAGQQSSAERNASHAVAKLSSIHFDPNTRPLRADNYRWMTTFLRQFYDQGKKDRANSLTQVQAEQRVKAFSECPTGPFRPEAQTSHIVSQVYSADRPKEQSQILLESATATYWDGYYGRP